MNSTNVGILNLLYHGRFSQNDLALYLDVDSKTLVKNIAQLNLNLKYLNLNQIELVNGKYELELNSEQWLYILNGKEFMSSEDIIDYLYLKFIFKGFINLEYEKNEFQISRSSINRYFLVVKNMLGENSSSYKYENAKGLRLIHLSPQDKNLFCKKLIKLFVKTDFSISPLTTYYTLFKDSQINELSEKLYKIFTFSEVASTKFIIAFSLALKICVDTFGGFSFNNNYSKLGQYIEIKELIEKELQNYSENYKQQIFSFLLNLKNKENFFEQGIIERAKVLMNELEKQLNIKKIEKGFKELLLKKLYMSLFKYENNILKVYSSKLNNDDKRLLKVLDEALIKTNLKIYFYDKIVILGILKKIIIEQNKKDINNILLLFNEIILPHDSYLKENLQKQIPHINIDIMPSFHLKFNYLNCINHYDLILSDEINQDSNVEKISSFNYLRVLEKIDKKAIEKGLNDLI
ncbi:hypothetical protein [Cetobacterium sp.]|uniref:hypothetical protein n=2 Tax=Cetobacterium sp. TaxID=2071632 RepID=UPI0025BCA305|nr:hypothetical protein [Cetobacterium sp.]